MSPKRKFSQILLQTKDLIDCSWYDMAKIFIVRERTVYRWLLGISKPHPSYRSKLRQFNEILDLVNEGFPTEEALQEWLDNRLPALRKRRPRNILKAGRIQEVVEVLKRKIRS